MPRIQSTISMNVPYGTPGWQVEKALCEALQAAQVELKGYGRIAYTVPEETPHTPEDASDAIVGLIGSLFETFGDRKAQRQKQTK